MTVDQYLQQLQDNIDALRGALGITICIAFVWLLILSFAVSEKAGKKERERIEELETGAKAEKKSTREWAGALTARVYALEQRLKAFEALERIGVAAQLSAEMLAQTDAEITAMERDTIEKMAQMRAQHDQTLAHLKSEMERFRDELSQVAGAGTAAR